MENRNWIGTFYDEDDFIIHEKVLIDRSEHEAVKECESLIENCYTETWDWTLVPYEFFNKK